MWGCGTLGDIMRECGKRRNDRKFAPSVMGFNTIRVCLCKISSDIDVRTSHDIAKITAIYWQDCTTLTAET